MGEMSPVHDAARTTTAAVLELFNLRDDELMEAYPMVYERVRKGLERFVAGRRRETCALSPVHLTDHGRKRVDAALQSFLKNFVHNIPAEYLGILVHSIGALVQQPGAVEVTPSPG